MKDFTQDIDGVVKWLNDYTEASHTKGYVIGLSGGVDSSVVASLCVKAVGKENVLGLILPIQSSLDDTDFATELAESLGIEYMYMNLFPGYKEIKSEYRRMNHLNDVDVIVQANLKSRLRMTALYMWAGTKNYLVAGTGNKSEDTIGFFTKYGDGGVDVLPIVEFYKTEIWEIAKILNVPEKIIDRPPTDGLWENHNDEDDFGMTYYELDTILKHINDEPIQSGAFTAVNLKKIKARIKQNEHKLIYPPGYKRRK